MSQRGHADLLWGRWASWEVSVSISKMTLSFIKVSRWSTTQKSQGESGLGWPAAMSGNSEEYLSYHLSVPGPSLKTLLSWRIPGLRQLHPSTIKQQLRYGYFQVLKTVA